MSSIASQSIILYVSDPPFSKVQQIGFKILVLAASGNILQIRVVHVEYAFL